MKRLAILSTAVAVLLSASVASAQIPATAQGTDAGRLDSKTSGSNLRVSQLMGVNLQNAQGESVGEINDLVLDSKTGKVQYAAVTYGGFLGMGDKLFAVPFEAFSVQRDPDDPNDADEFVVVLNVSQKQLDGAVGFDHDHWPNMADQKWARDLDTRYGVDRTRMRDRSRGTGVDVNVNRNGVDVDVNRNRGQ